MKPGVDYHRDWYVIFVWHRWRAYVGPHHYAQGRFLEAVVLRHGDETIAEIPGPPPGPFRVGDAKTELLKLARARGLVIDTLKEG